jgi:hypothetical protein
MIELFLFVIIGIILFAGFLVLGFKGSPRTAPDSSVVSAVGQMVRLEGLAFPNAPVLLDESEYQLLCSNPYLHEVAKRFRRERQELAIAWISLLQADLKTLWRFHRFLISRGAPSQFREEIEILQTYILSVILLSVLKALIRTSGPFALSRAARRARRLVDNMSDAAANSLGRIPPTGWPELERSWASAA